MLLPEVLQNFFLVAQALPVPIFPRAIVAPAEAPVRVAAIVAQVDMHVMRDPDVAHQMVKIRPPPTTPAARFAIVRVCSRREDAEEDDKSPPESVFPTHLVKRPVIPPVSQDRAR